MLGGTPKAGGDQQGTEFITAQPNGVRLIGQPWPSHMRSGRMSEQLLLDGVPVEPGQSAQAAGDGGPGPAAGFQIEGE
jgi:hypothetical protein